MSGDGGGGAELRGEVARLGEHRHGQPPGGVLACQPSWHGTCRHCRKPLSRCFEIGGHPIWLHDNPPPGAAYSRCEPATYAEPMTVVVVPDRFGAIPCPNCNPAAEEAS